MYTWGYIKENTLSKLNLDEEEANQLGFLSRFPYFANEAMTQICSAIKPCEKYYEIEVEDDETTITMPSDFIGFSDDIAYYRAKPVIFAGREVYCDFQEAGDEILSYVGYNEIICKKVGTYRIPYKARWFFFTKELHNSTEITAPADICDAIPSYIASQCLKIDDETKAAVYRNEYEMFLARIDDTNFKSQRTFRIGGGW